MRLATTSQPITAPTHDPLPSPHQLNLNELKFEQQAVHLRIPQKLAEHFKQLIEIHSPKSRLSKVLGLAHTNAHEQQAALILAATCIRQAKAYLKTQNTPSSQAHAHPLSFSQRLQKMWNALLGRQTNTHLQHTQQSIQQCLKIDSHRNRYQVNKLLHHPQLIEALQESTERLINLKNGTQYINQKGKLKSTECPLQGPDGTLYRIQNSRRDFQTQTTTHTVINLFTHRRETITEANDCNQIRQHHEINSRLANTLTQLRREFLPHFAFYQNRDPITQGPENTYWLFNGESPPRGNGQQMIKQLHALVQQGETERAWVLYKSIFYQFLAIMNTLHSKQNSNSHSSIEFIHGNLNPNNLLFFTHADGSMLLKLTGFENTREIRHTQTNNSRIYLNTPYVPTEIQEELRHTGEHPDQHHFIHWKEAYQAATTLLAFRAALEPEGTTINNSTSNNQLTKELNDLQNTHFIIENPNTKQLLPLLKECHEDNLLAVLLNPSVGSKKKTPLQHAWFLYKEKTHKPFYNPLKTNNLNARSLDTP